MNKFQIIEKSSDQEKAFFLRKNIFGINVYQWSFVEFTQTFFAPLIIFVNIMSYNYFNTLTICIIHTLSIAFSYHIGKKKYKSINDAEHVIKKYVKEQTTKKTKSLPSSKTSNVLNYTIDIDKGIFEKEFQSSNRK